MNLRAPEWQSRAAQTLLALTLITPTPPQTSAAFARGQAQGHDRDRDHEHAHAQDDQDEGARGEVGARLHELDRRVLALITSREDARRALKALTPELKQTRQQLRALSAQLNAQRQALSRAFTLRRRLKGARVAELLLSANGPLELKRREINLRATLSVGVRELEELLLTQRALSDAEQELSEREQSASALKADLSQQVDDLLKLRAEEARLLNPGLPSLSAQNKALRLPPPTLGAWEDTFQSYRGFQLAKLYGHGVKIKGKQGAPVFSVEEGEVLYTGWVRNRGGVVIIAHPQFMGLKRVKSVYSGVEGKVKVGQQVKRQGLIGELNAERSDGRLSFELRHEDRPIYPRRYIHEVSLEEDTP